MTSDDKQFLRKMLADLSVFPHIQIGTAEMARCFRLMIIKALEEPGLYNSKQGSKEQRVNDEVDE